jgi:hypothetical protein
MEKRDDMLTTLANLEPFMVRVMVARSGDQESSRDGGGERPAGDGAERHRRRGRWVPKMEPPESSGCRMRCSTVLASYEREEGV